MSKSSSCPAPYIRSFPGTKEIGIQLLIALLPACLSVFYHHGAKGFLYVAASAFLFSGIEYFTSEYVLKIEDSKNCFDFFSTATGIMVALVLPANLPPVFFAVLIIVLAILGRQMLERKWMIFFTLPQVARWLGLLFHPELFTQERQGFLSLIAGRSEPVLGAECIIALLIGFAYLMTRRWMRSKMVLLYFIFLIGGYFFWHFYIPLPPDLITFLFQNGIMFYGLFGLSDPRHTPATFSGQILFAAAAAGLLFLFIVMGFSRMSVSLSCIIMNIIVYVIGIPSNRLFLKNLMDKRRTFDVKAAVPEEKRRRNDENIQY